MVDFDAPDVDFSLIEELGRLGPVFGLVLIAVGLFLMVRGHESLAYVAAATGAGIGYLLTPAIYSLVSPHVEVLEQIHLMGILVLLTAGILLATIQLSIALMGSFVFFLAVRSAFQWLEGRGMEFADSELITNAIGVLAFFSVIWIRKQLPLFVSALLGSIATLGGMLILYGRQITDLDAKNSSTIAIVLLLFTISVTVQMRSIKRRADAENLDENGDPIPDKIKTDPRRVREPSQFDLPDLR